MRKGADRILKAKKLDLALIEYSENDTSRKAYVAVGERTVVVLDPVVFNLERGGPPKGIAPDWFADGVFRALGRKPVERSVERPESDKATKEL